MRTSLLIVLAVGLSVGVGGVSGVPDRPPKVDPAVRRELGRLQGAWVWVEGGSRDYHDLDRLYTGYVVLPPQIVTLTIKGSRAVMAVGGKVSGKFTLRIDPAKNPKWFDLRPTGKGGKAVFGIYKIDGDRLKVCYTLSGTGRPTGFSVKAGTGERSLNVWTYQRKAKSK
jgi:uncharacterized protein (TIGR03067 family)